MKILIAIFTLICLFCQVAVGQNNRINKASTIELQLIKDLLSSINTEISFVVSPIMQPNNYSEDDIQEYIKSYGFSRASFLNDTTEKFIEQLNSKIIIIPIDTFLQHNQYRKQGTFDVPIQEYIEKIYHKDAICYFYTIVFSKNKKHALVHYKITCGIFLCHGELVLMKKKNHKWIIEDTIFNESY